MRVVRRFAAALVLSLSAFMPMAADAQQPTSSGSSDTVVASPTRLRISTRGGNILLTWVDAQGSTNGCAVYRDVKPINAASLADAELLGKIGAAVQSFTDSPPDTREYFYVILPLSSAGEPVPVFSAGKNSSQVGVAADVVAPAAAAAPVQGAAAPAAQPSSPAATAAAPETAAAPAAPVAPAPTAATATATSPTGAAPTAPKPEPAKTSAAPSAAAPSAAATVPAATKPAAALTTPSATAPKTPAATVAPSQAGTKPSAAAMTVDSLVAKTHTDSVILTYKAIPGTRLVLYRGLSPLRTASDLLDATLVAAFKDKDGAFADYPVPGVDYWYALVGEEDLKQGRISLVEGRSSTSASVRLPSKPGTATVAEIVEVPPTSRTPPLPAFLLEEGIGEGKRTLPQDESPPPARALSAEAEKAVASLLARAPAPTPKRPKLVVLPQELSAPTGGEDYSLSIIVSDKLGAMDWTGAIDQLRNYLSLNRSAAAIARARFYLGQALANTAAYRDAFFEFLLARDEYPSESKEWIDYILFQMRDQG